MKRMGCFTLWVLGVTALVGCSSGSLTIQDAWVRPGVAAGNSAVYFVVDNPLGEADSLLQATTPAAGAVELHETMHHADDTMSMTPQAEVSIPARSKVIFEPGGKHIMLINLVQDLKPGDIIRITLTFANAGALELDVLVREP